MIARIRKRDGRYVKFNEEKILEAIQKAVIAVEAEVTVNRVNKITKEVVKRVEETTPEGRVPTVEYVQDVVEEVLMLSKLPEVAKAYILYREERSRVRDRDSRLMKTFQEIETDKKTTSDFLQRRKDFHYENPARSIISYGREGAKEYNRMFVIDPKYTKLHENGDIYIKEMEYYNSSFNTLQIDIEKLFKEGIEKDNTIIKNPETFNEYILFLSFVIAKAENDLYGGIQIPNFDFIMAKAVRKNYHKLFVETLLNIEKLFEFVWDLETLIKDIESQGKTFQIGNHDLDGLLVLKGISEEKLKEIHQMVETKINDDLFKALHELLLIIKMMPTKNSDGVVNLSISYGTDTSKEGRLVIKNILKATQKGAPGNHLFTAPVQVFKIKEDINYKKNDKNFDLYNLAVETTAKTMYPNYLFLDSTPNIIEGVDNLEHISIGSTRNRVIYNTIEYNKSPLSRGSIAETVINLPRLALVSKKIDVFYKNLELLLEDVVEQLLERYRGLSNLKALHLPFLMQDHAWRDASSLDVNDNISSIIRNGSLDVGFAGLAEALVALTGKHHGQSEESRHLGLEIIRTMNNLLETYKNKYDLNFQLVASSKVGTTEEFIYKDQQRFGIIQGVTDKTFYTDSFHVPSNYPIVAEDKIIIEAPYHSLITGGHITYIELGGKKETKPNSIHNLIKIMKQRNIGYAAINHDLDFDPICGYYGNIETSICPGCERVESSAKPFLKYRRVNDITIAPINLVNFEHEEVELRVKNIKNLIKISGLVNDSIVDGPGMRFVVFTQGCLVGCKGCHNPETWDPEGGRLVEVDDIVKAWQKNPLIEGITISGGDPFLQPDKTLYLVKKAKETNLSVVVYSGRYYEELLDLENPAINEILKTADILIDGPFEIEKLNLELPYRGSDNQRVIDLNKTNKDGQIAFVSV